MQKLVSVLTLLVMTSLASRQDALAMDYLSWNEFAEFPMHPETIAPGAMGGPVFNLEFGGPALNSTSSKNPIKIAPGAKKQPLSKYEPELPFLDQDSWGGEIKSMREVALWIQGRGRDAEYTRLTDAETRKSFSLSFASRFYDGAAHTGGRSSSLFKQYLWAKDYWLKAADEPFYTQRNFWQKRGVAGETQLQHFVIVSLIDALALTKLKKPYDGDISTNQEKLKTALKYCNQFGPLRDPDLVAVFDRGDSQRAGARRHTSRCKLFLQGEDITCDKIGVVYSASGNARARIQGQDSSIEADTINYDKKTKMLTATGRVRIFRNFNLTTGSSFKFNIDSDEYLVTNPGSVVVKVSLQEAKGN